MKFACLKDERIIAFDDIKYEMALLAEKFYLFW